MRPIRRSLRLLPTLPLALLSLFTHAAQAGDERQLLAAINDYRTHSQRCGWSSVQAAPPLKMKANVALPVGYSGELRRGLRDAGYVAGEVRSIRLSGARDARLAFDMLRDDYCTDLMDPQVTDVGISRSGNQWRLVLARPMASAQLGDTRSAGQALLAQVNAARAKPRMCGGKRFAAARPLAWSTALGSAAQQHSRSMANRDYFSHNDPNGDSPFDRARAAGYRGRQVGENIAAGQGSPRAAMDSWLASPGHCANLMNPRFTQVGAAYAAQTRSENGIYWTMMFGAP
ncbi:MULTISPECIES: CAP domain-containing protein [unclassified Pseudomonas]|uniref:CAP domain-containing protein n=1 Tax=unclassified Pseudomonas TaxID=196821 RepID=UPI00129E44E2|nr:MULTISPECIES: CAP domain-containing protein [unclassified Pseudomonas]MDH4653372.1 CAP domain-containing protein [Pseudomonas sp. BN606]MRK21157.1 CAP domain-containing protein [Pseudomonas sp. JG-B]